MRLTFIVGSGRCGSTMLSRMLTRHPDVLSVSEFFCTLTPGSADLPLGKVNGQQLWRVLSSPEPSLDGIVRDGLATPELCYPYGRGRFNVDTGVPRICHMTLPTLTDDPDAMFDKLAAEVPTWPTRSAAEQISALFDYLANLQGCQVVVERTAGSLLFTEWLHRQFSGARFVHAYRDGPDCALSMSTHPGVRLMALMEQAGLLDRGPARRSARSAMSPQLRELLTPPIVMRRVMAHPAPPLAVYGKLWSRMMISGAAALRRLPPGTWMTMKYEDLLGAPERELTRLAELAGASARPDWLAASRATVDAGRSGQAARLDPETLAALRAACQPGVQALASAGAGGPFTSGSR
jgi:hypothetical protein